MFLKNKHYFYQGDSKILRFQGGVNLHVYIKFSTRLEINIYYNEWFLVRYWPELNNTNTACCYCL